MDHEKPRVIFFGTPEFSVPCLNSLIDIANVLLVVSQPDRRAGRGLKIVPTPVKLAAEQRGIETIQPKKIRTKIFANRLRDLRADVGIVVAYGRILPPSILNAPRLGCLNLHASLLPKYRGAAPIQWSVVHGENETGICMMQMDEGMDTGAVLAIKRTDIGPDEMAVSLSKRLSIMGAELLCNGFIKYINNELTPTPQNHDLATYAPILHREDGLVDWNKSARQVHNLVRGMTPWPGAYTWLDDRRIKLHRSHLLSEEKHNHKPGTIICADNHGLDVACGKGILVIDELQVEGKKRMSIEQFLAGNPLPRFACFTCNDSEK